LEEIITPALINTIVVCFTVLSAIVVISIGAKNKWFNSMSIGKGGITLQSKEAEKEFQSGNIQQLMNEHIYKCDTELVDYAIERANYLRKTIANQLSKHFACLGMRHAITGVLRFPLYNASMQNNFKAHLKPEHILWYVERLIQEIKAEYEEYALLQDMSFCIRDEQKCPPMPEVNKILLIIKDEILNNWALAIRRKTIDICNKKIEIYRQFVPSFHELNDQVKIKVTEHCIEKNKNYIEALVRTPDINKKEI
jgi:hypothetical protein